MKGTFRPLTPSRRIILDLMHAARNDPTFAIRWTVKLDALVAARHSLSNPPGWAAIFTRAFGLAARDEPRLRTMFIGWPWPHLVEMPKTFAKLAVHRHDIDGGAVMFAGVATPEEFSLSFIDGTIRQAKTAAIADVDVFRRAFRFARLWLPLRRLLLAIALNVPRLRIKNFGTLGVTSSAIFGTELVAVRAPVPYILSYGRISPDNTIELTLHVDHRVCDAAEASRAMSQLEVLLNGALADEVRSLASSTPKA